nr:MAG TPA: minor structural protein [Caudoviricetes sp.]
MTKEELKALGLTDEQITKVVEDYGKNYVAKTQFNQKNEELKAAKEELTKANSDLETLKKDNKDNAELVKQIDALKAESKTRQGEYDAKIKQMQIDAIVERTLLTAKAKNPKAVKALLDLEKAEIDGEAIKGLDDQLKKLQESDAYLFEAADGKPKVDGVKPGEGGDHGDDNGNLSDQQVFENALGL